MEKSQYLELKQNPPKIKLEGSLDKIIINMVSCMCDNKSQITIMRKDNNYSIWATLGSGMGYSISNYQFKHPVNDIIWEAEELNWKEVIKMINSGTAVIESVKSR